MDKKIIILACILAISAIIFGAFGAHALKDLLSLEQLMTFETAVKYQMYHALFLLFLATNTYISSKAKKTITILTVLGIVFFSGSIYLLATNNLTTFDFKVIGFITPIGGVLLIVAWSFLLLQFLKKKA